jgi:hypothetical protein
LRPASHSAWCSTSRSVKTEGLLRSIANVLSISIAIPDHTTLSRRGGGLTILPKHIDGAEPLHLLVNSTGLKICGEGEWLDQKHGIRSRRRWRIFAVELTPDDVGDISEIPHLLYQIDAHVVSMTANGAYDGESVYDAVRTSSWSGGYHSAQNDSGCEWGHHNTAQSTYCWQRRSGYGRSSLVETAMFRYKTIIGLRVHARNLPNQRTEAKIGCSVLNRMTALGMPASARIL